MRTSLVIALSICLLALVGSIGISRINTVPSAEATHESAIVILGCGPTANGFSYQVEAYSASTEAPDLREAVRDEESCAQVLVDLMEEDFGLMGIESGAFTNGLGPIYTLAQASPHVEDDD